VAEGRWSQDMSLNGVDNGPGSNGRRKGFAALRLHECLTEKLHAAHRQRAGRHDNFFAHDRQALDFEGGFMGREREKIVKIVTLNDAATLRITHAILERRRPGKHFTIVFVSSLASLFPMPLKATYAASKRFLLDFATSLRQELKNQDANAIALCPGGMVTTREAMEGIAAQGFWGDATTNPLEVVARKTLDRALKGKGIYIPGGLNRMLSFFGKIVPRSCVAAVVYWRWRRAQEHGLNSAASHMI